MSNSSHKPRESTATSRATPARKATSAAADKPAGAPNAESADIQRSIEHTREQLADTVDALAHKVNVPEQVKDKVHEAAETVQAKAEDVTQQVSEQVQEGVQTLQNTADQVATQVRDLADQGLAKLPPPVRQRIEQLITMVRQRPIPAAVVTVLAFLVLRRLLRRNR